MYFILHTYLHEKIQTWWLYIPNGSFAIMGLVPSRGWLWPFSLTAITRKRYSPPSVKPCTVKTSSYKLIINIKHECSC